MPVNTLSQDLAAHHRLCMENVHWYLLRATAAVAGLKRRGKATNPARPPLNPGDLDFVSQVDDELAKECAAPGGAGVLGALSRIVRRHGKAGLWRGMVPVLLTMGVSNFVYFYCFNGMKVRYSSMYIRWMFCAPRALFMYWKIFSILRNGLNFT